MKNSKLTKSIVSLAAIAEMKDNVLVFLGAGMRKASVEYFPYGEEEKARNWLRDVFWKSMAITIMAGLTVGTIITMIVLPVLYTVFYRIRSPDT